MQSESAFAAMMPDKTHGAGESAIFIAIPPKRNARQSGPPSLFSAKAQQFLFLDYARELGHWHCSASAEKYDYRTLTILRVHAGSPEKSVEGVYKCLEYYWMLRGLELTFPFGTDEVGLSFSWFGAFASGDECLTTCIQYEKAAVLFNIASIYSSIAVASRSWTPEGKKTASLNFQKSAGLLLHIRDVCCSQFKLNLSQSSDLHESSLTALATLMLAQAAECYYNHANDDASSSAVTSIVAVYTSDLYSVALSQLNLGGYTRVPSAIARVVSTKLSMFSAIAHFHAGSTLDSSDACIAERLARLQVASSMIAASLLTSSRKTTHLHAMVTGYATCISDAITRINESGFRDLPVHDARLLCPLKRPPAALVNPIPPNELFASRHILEKAQDVQKDMVYQVRGLLDAINGVTEKIKRVQGEVRALVGKTPGTVHTDAKLLELQTKKYFNEVSQIDTRVLQQCLHKCCVLTSTNLKLTHEKLKSDTDVKLYKIWKKLTRELESCKRTHKTSLQLQDPQIWSVEQLQEVVPCMSMTQYAYQASTKAYADRITAAGSEFEVLKGDQQILCKLQHDPKRPTQHLVVLENHLTKLNMVHLEFVSIHNANPSDLLGAQSGIVNEHMDLLKNITETRSELMLCLWRSLDIREISARLVIETKSGHGITQYGADDPILSRVDNEGYVFTVEYLHRHGTFDELFRELVESFILPLEKDVGGSGGSGTYNVNQQVSSTSLESSTSADTSKKEDTYGTGFNRLFKGVTDGLSKLMSVAIDTKPAESQDKKGRHESKVLKMFRNISSSAWIPPEDPNGVEDDYVSAVMKENARLRGIVLKSRQQRRNDQHRPTTTSVTNDDSNGSPALKKWIASQVSHSPKPHPGFKHDTDYQTARLATAVAVGVRASQQLVFTAIPGQFDVQSEAQLCKSGQGLERGDSGVATSRQHSFEDGNLKSHALKLNFMTGIKQDNDEAVRRFADDKWWENA